MFESFLVLQEQNKHKAMQRRYFVFGVFIIWCGRVVCGWVFGGLFFDKVGILLRTTNYSLAFLFGDYKKKEVIRWGGLLAFL